MEPDNRPNNKPDAKADAKADAKVDAKTDAKAVSGFGNDIRATQEALENRMSKLVEDLAEQEKSRFSQVRTRADSYTEHAEIVMYRHTNGSGRLFGGALLQMIDTVGAICARRHSGTEVTTVAIDNLSFKAPASLNSTIILISEIESVGRTSMKIKVTTYVEALNGTREEINVAHMTFVALDRFNRPTPVPRLDK